MKSGMNAAIPRNKKQMRIRILAIGLAATIGAEARADGFAVHDLAILAPEVGAALGSDFSHKSDPRRVTLICPTCAGEPVVDLQLGRQADGTEERVRSGETPFSRLEKLCQERNPSCRLAALDVGWISTYSMDLLFASTAVILRGGDLLTIRSMASTADAARSNAEKVVRAVRPKLIGN